MKKHLIICPICNSQKQHKHLSSKDFNQQISPDKFVYYQCNHCGSIFLHPIPSNLSDYYGKSYPAYEVKLSPQQEFQYARFETAKLEFIKQFVPSGRLIEVGPASGLFMTAAHRAGYHVVGIEQDAGCVHHIQNVLKLDVRLSENPSIELRQMASFNDIIVAWHVIEHLVDLRGFIAAAVESLRKPDGIIALSAPNPEARSFKLFGRYWVHLDAPRHVTLIPLQALDILMNDFGMKRVSTIFDDPVGLQLSRSGWQASLLNLHRHNKLPWILYFFLVRVLHKVMDLFDRRHNSGAAYTVAYKFIS